MQIFSKVDDPAAETGDITGQDPVDFTEVKQKLFGTRGKSAKRKKPSESEHDVVQKELDQIFAGENWEEVAALYFNSRFALTGWDGFLLTEGQKKTLGISLATTMKMLLKIDPGYVALIVFTTNFGGLIAQKEVVYKKLLSQEKEKNRAETPLS